MYSTNNDYIKALIVYNYLGDYNKFENLIKEEFVSKFELLTEEYKNRVYFYLGGVGSLNTYIDYDTYSLVKETNKYNDRKLLSRLTMNQIIKLERREQGINKFNQNIMSIQWQRLEYTFCDCCIKLTSMRNRMAHEFFNLDIKEEKDTIEVLSNANIEKFKPKWLENFNNYDELDFNIKSILSNYIYMKEMEKLLVKN